MTMSRARRGPWVFLCLALSGFVGVVTGDNNCSVGTFEDECVSASSEVAGEYYFCTDRYSWEWSQDVSQLPHHSSDSLCITMDSNVVEGLEQTEILVLGGCDADSQAIQGECSSVSKTTYSFDPVSDAFTTREDMPVKRFRSAAVNVSNHVYLFGGRDLDGALVCTVDRYDVITGTWESLNSTQDTNCFSDHSGVATDDGTMYLFGGWDELYVAQSTVVKVEVSGDGLVYSNASEPMGERRGDHVCARVPASTDVYCMGGFTDEDSEYILLKSVERFDTSTETWEYRADMVNPRADFGVGHLNDRITIMGGEDQDHMPMDDVEWYDPETDCWTDSGEMFDLPYKRLRYCAAPHQSDQRIYIFGGQSLPGPTNESYNITGTVNWYQEILVDQLSPSAGSATFVVSVALAFGAAAAQLILSAVASAYA